MGDKLFPGMNVVAMMKPYYVSISVYNFLKINVVFVKLWWLPTHPDNQSEMIYQVEWHYGDSRSKEYISTNYG